MSSELPVTASWGDLLQGKNGLQAVALTGGVVLHAVNVHIVTTILPSVVQDIGGLDWYAWNTTLFVVASIVGATLSARLLFIMGPRGAYMAALAVFALGSIACATAMSMPWMLVGRSVQGMGGGVLAALSYALIRIVFAQPLWPRAVALVSGMWGVATLCGPAVGGFFAQTGHWRWAFWVLLPVALLQALLVAVELRPIDETASLTDSKPEIPIVQIGLLALSVLAVAAGSLSPMLMWQCVGLAGGLALGMVAIAFERRASVRLLPRGATGLRSHLGAVYAIVALLLVGTTTEVYIPYFLQTLHGYTPLAAGWSVGSLFSSGREGKSAVRLLRAGPVLCSISLLALAVLVPASVGMAASVQMLLCGVMLLGAGAGVGIGWPHLLTQILVAAPSDEGGMASAAITTVQLYGMDVGAAIAGLVVNAAGLVVPGGMAGTQSAAAWLFASFSVAPILATVLVYRVSSRVRQAV